MTERRVPPPLGGHSKLRVELAYGDAGLSVMLPETTTVVAPRHPVAAPDAPAELRRALSHPLGSPRLRDRVRPGQRLAVAICDGTRPQPREAMLTALLDELEGVVDDGDITVIVATGTHAPPSHAEVVDLVGAPLARRLHVVGHDARRPDDLADCGVQGAGVPVFCNREFLAADLKITTGFVEPHFFAGFSGGPKLVAPGLLGMASVLVLHDAARIGSPEASWGNVVGNPVHDDVRAIAAAIGVDFAFDVVLDRRQRIVRGFAGELFAMHASAVEFARSVATTAVPALFDVVVTTNAGYPLDRNLYQAVKGMSAAAQIVRPGGLIVAAAQCRDGFPDFGEFRTLVLGAASVDELVATIDQGETRPDQWQVQVLARVLRRARVALHCEGLSDDEVRAAHLEPVRDIGARVAQELAELGPGARCAVLPEGPATIPYVAPVFPAGGADRS